MSKPVTQNRTATAKTNGIFKSLRPRIAIHAAIGAIISDTPNHTWASAVNFLASEYAQMKTSTGSAKMIGQGFGGFANRNSAVAAMKPRLAINVNDQTANVESFPEGKWRFDVRGLRASIRRSTNRLKAMAALRANTMQTMMPTRSIHWNLRSLCQASSALINANGSAKIV